MANISEMTDDKQDTTEQLGVKNLAQQPTWQLGSVGIETQNHPYGCIFYCASHFRV